MWVVCKFGGTSVANARNWSIISHRAKTLVEEGFNVWITVSALSQVTNRLIAAIDESVNAAPHTNESERMKNYDWIKEAHRLILVNLGVEEFPKEVLDLLSSLKRLLNGIFLTSEASPRLKAKICAHGELLSSAIGFLALQRDLVNNDSNYPSTNSGDGVSGGTITVKIVDSRNYLTSYEYDNMTIDDRYLSAEVIPVSNVEEVEKTVLTADASDANNNNNNNNNNSNSNNNNNINIVSGTVVISQGFIAYNSKKETVLLGRGGSDTSGTLFGALLKAKKVEIWTDVNGIFTGDPRIIASSRLIRELSYREAQEIAGMGAKVLHPRCLGPARFGDIPVEIRNTMDPEPGCEFTRISSAVSDNKKILAVTCRHNQTLVNLTSYNMWEASGFLFKVFEPFGSLGISVDLIATSTYSVSITLDHIPGGVTGDPFKKLMKILDSLGETSYVHPVSVVSVVGRKIRSSLDRLGRSMTLFQLKEVLLISQSAEDLNMSYVMSQSDAKETVEILHSNIFPDTTKIGDGDNNNNNNNNSIDVDVDVDVILDDLLFGATWKSLQNKQCFSVTH